MSEFLRLFDNPKPVIGMLHLGRRNSKSEALDLTKYEVDTYLENGIDGVIVENYFGDLIEVEETLNYLYCLKKEIVYGVNYLGDYEKAFELAEDFAAKFLQIDSVCGHLTSLEDIEYAKNLKNLRQQKSIPVIGGVRFKYQPYLSGRSLEEDLKLGMERCEGIVVTGTGTGIEMPIQKAKDFKEIINDFPLIIGAGLNLDNVTESLSIADAAIIGSYVKDNHQDDGIVLAKNVQTLMKKVKQVR